MGTRVLNVDSAKSQVNCTTATPMGQEHLYHVSKRPSPRSQRVVTARMPSIKLLCLWEGGRDQFLPFCELRYREPKTAREIEELLTGKIENGMQRRI